MEFKEILNNYGSSALYIKIISEKLEHGANNICRKFGLTIGQMRLLGVIYHTDDKVLPMKLLEKYFSVSQATMQGMVNRVEKKGLVLVEKDSHDKRRKNVYLTDTGSQLYQETFGIISQYSHQFEQYLTEDENKNFNYLLQKILNQL